MEICADKYAQHFKGFIVLDCVVRSQNIFYFALSEDYSQWPSWDGGEGRAEDDLAKRVVIFMRHRPQEERWDSTDFSDLHIFNAGVSYFPKEQFVGVTFDGGAVYVLGSGEDEFEEALPSWVDGGFLRGEVSRCRTIDGHVYIAGGGRTVAMRRGRNDWVALSKELPYDDNEDWERAGFNDIDGFDANDIYCVGGKGDVWHFNGETWIRVHFPSNIDLSSVCCGSNGQVYISGYGGTTFKGRGQKWKQIYKDEMTVPFRRMVWYEDKVWCTSDYGLWTIEKDKVKPADVDDEIKVCSGYISVKDDVMLIAGHSGAAYKEAGVWHKIF